jgi:hypothetical protein
MARRRLLLGKSLSGLFTVYALLARPTAFDAYVGCSAGWFAENDDYFLELSTRAFRTVESFARRAQERRAGTLRASAATDARILVLANMLTRLIYRARQRVRVGGRTATCGLYGSSLMPMFRHRQNPPCTQRPPPWT